MSGLYPPPQPLPLPIHLNPICPQFHLPQLRFIQPQPQPQPQPRHDALETTKLPLPPTTLVPFSLSSPTPCHPMMIPPLPPPPQPHSTRRSSSWPSPTTLSPAPLWHFLFKSLCASSSSSSSIGLAYAVVSWLQKHNLCFSYELLYSILIHALGRSEKLYEAFLLSQRQSLTPLTYNALIGACARNDDLEKALHLMSHIHQDGYDADFVNYNLIIQSLTRSNKIDSPIMLKLYREIESKSIEIDGQFFNDIIAGCAKAGEPSQAMHLLAMVQATGLSPKTATVVTVISSLGNSGRVIEAEAIFEEMREGRLQPRTRAYNALLKGHVKAGQLKDAESIVSRPVNS